MISSFRLWLAFSFCVGWPVLSSPTKGRDGNDPSTMFYELYTRWNPTEAQILRLDDVAALQRSNFDPNLPTKIHLHGWNDDASAGYPSRNEFLTREDCNFISVDWSELASGPEPFPFDYPFIVRDNVPIAGKYLAFFIEFLITEAKAPISSFHLTGHSLGAHVAGEAGEQITLGKIPRITGLDPAGPFFFLNNTDTRLDTTDAEFVDIIHTDAGKLTGNELGFAEPIGHVDFYPNGGENQNGCSLIPPRESTRNGCDHGRAPTYFTESINSPAGFRAVECDSWENFKAGLCDGNKAEMMGEPTSSSAQGVFYLATNPKPPFAMG